MLILLLTTLVRSASSLRLDRVDQRRSNHVPLSAMFKALTHVQILECSGRHLMGTKSPGHQQDSHKLLVVSYSRELIMMVWVLVLLVDQTTTHQMGGTVV